MINQDELRQLENRCIQEHAPTCTAACPVHVDVRGMIAAILKDGFAAGLKVLRKTMPFPGIISHICDQPCMEVCKRGEVGEAIEIAALEKACVMWGGEGEAISALPPKPKNAAVVGGGLSGMTVAYDLRRKGYRVVIYEAGSQLGGTLWHLPQELLPWSVILKDIAVLDQLGVEIFLDTSVGKVGTNGRRPPLTQLCQQYDAVYLGIGADASEIQDLTLDSQGQIQIDPVTYMTSQDGVFAGGSLLFSRIQSNPLESRAALTAQQQLLQPPSGTVEGAGFVKETLPWRSTILSVMDGRRAATSIDRYLQKVSLTATRANEGPYTTRLYTSVQGIPPLPAVKPADQLQGYSKEEAVEETQRCIQCECMECVKVCEYLQHYGGYPKKYVREIYNNLSIVMGTRYSNRFINSCSLCGLCGEVCPEDLDMGSVCKQAREIMVQQKRMPPSAHDFALRDMAFSNSENFVLARTPPGLQTCQYAFFPGCQLSASYPDYVDRVYAYLNEQLSQALPGAVGLMLRCCGAPADWAGRSDIFQASRIEFMADYERLGNPKLVLACSSCYQLFKTRFPEVEILSLWEVMDSYGLPAGATAGSQFDHHPLAMHDPCSTRYETNIQDSARNILQHLGYQLHELPLNREKTECCSYGGLMWLAHPELATAVVQRRIAESRDDFVTYCAMCRDFFVRQGKPTLHLLDLIFNTEMQSALHKAGPGYSDRHENRRRLKRRLLDRFWGEKMESEKSYQSIQLILLPEVQQLLEDRLILVEDIQQVIEHAEGTGRKLKNKRTGHFLAYFQPASVTYWVEYTPQGEAYVIHKAYSHRMEIGKEGQ